LALHAQSKARFIYIPLYHCGLFEIRRDKVSHVPRLSSCSYAPLSDPGWTLPSGVTMARYCSRHSDGESSMRYPYFAAQSRGFWAYCLRFTPLGHPRSMQDSFPAACQAFPGGISYPQDSGKRFQSVFSHPPSLSFVTQRHPWLTAPTQVRNDRITPGTSFASHNLAVRLRPQNVVHRKRCMKYQVQIFKTSVSGPPAVGHTTLSLNRWLTFPFLFFGFLHSFNRLTLLDK